MEKKLSSKVNVKVTVRGSAAPKLGDPEVKIVLDTLKKNKVKITKIKSPLTTRLWLALDSDSDLSIQEMAKLLLSIKGFKKTKSPNSWPNKNPINVSGYPEAILQYWGNIIKEPDTMFLFVLHLLKDHSINLEISTW